MVQSPWSGPNFLSLVTRTNVQDLKVYCEVSASISSSVSIFASSIVRLSRSVFQYLSGHVQVLASYCSGPCSTL
ncbi:hypothetical protein Y1Q_0003002 [Alligator mississippiensis]|uniref:Uncharacterized protein n=1 Tax=Alligator mississippiensis TaxID=8496 RepID=A0A151MD34_ALLMI|nr:hypothetical protein Y1Q_0003002 [Alligator mississippiensis]